MKICKIDPNVNHWVVRPGNGAKYLEHFKSHNIIALGHMDEINFPETGILKEVDSSDLANALTKILKDAEQKVISAKKAEMEAKGFMLTEDELNATEITASHINSRVSQACRFIHEMKIGDVVITLNKNQVLVGTIVSDSYIEDDELIVFTSEGNASKRTLSYQLRRKVHWENLTQRRSIPDPIKPSLNAKQALFSIGSNHKELFSHWLYSMFIQGDTLHFSTKIDEAKKIGQFSVTEFQRIIQQLEFVAIKLENNDFDFDYDNLLSELYGQYFDTGVEEGYTLTTKNSFLSPGNIWNEVSGSQLKLTLYSLLLASMFSTNVIASEDINITSEQHEAIIKVAMILKDEGKFDLFKTKIAASLDKPNKSTEKREAKDLNKKVIIFPKLNEKGDTGI